MGTSEPGADVTVGETLEVFEDPERRCVPLTVAEVAVELSCSRETANRHLTRLAERGRIDSKDVTGDARVWWRPSAETPGAGRRGVEHKPLDESVSGVDEGTEPGVPAGRVHSRRGLLARILETVPEYVAVVSRGGGVEWTDERVGGRPQSAFDGSTGDTVDDLVVYGPGGTRVPAGERPWERVFETGEAVRDWRGRLETPRGRVEVSATALPLGGARPPERIVLTLSDVATAEEQARRVERRGNELEAEIAEIHERMDDAVFALDDDWRLTYVNERARSILVAAMERDRTVESLEGLHLWEEIPEAVDTAFYDRYHEAMETQETVTFEAYFEPLETWFDVRAYPSETGLSVYFKDVTERKARERELERYETIVETVEDGIYVVDQDGYFVEVNEAYESMAGRSREELIGSHVSMVTPQERILREAKRLEEELAAGERSKATLEAEIELEDGETWVGEATFSLMTSDSGYERVAVVRDVTERKERERALEESERRYRTLVEHFPNGAVALVDRSLRYWTVGGTPLDIADVTVPELEGRPVGEVLPAELADRLVPRYEAALRGETASFERAFDDRIYQFRIVPVRDEDGEVFAAMGMSQDVTERKARERQLERQRSQLATLNSLNELVHEISRLVIESSTREEIERLVCEHLAGSSSYRVAWIGDFDPDQEEITPRVATDDEGSLRETAFGAGAASVEAALAVRALRTGEVQVTRGIDEAEDEEFLRGYAREHGVSSAATIPIVHAEASYGVLTVYSERPAAFEADERTVIGRLGWTVGHAINAIERKRALMSEDVVELEFRVWDALGGLDASVPARGTITFDRTIPLGEGQFLQYGTATPDAREMLDAVTAFPHCEEVTVFGDDTAERRFELRLSEPPAVSAIASQGGHIKQFSVEDGDITLVVHLPQNADASRVIELLESEYDGAEMVAKRQTTRAEEPSRRIETTLKEQLTEKQRAALEAAYFAGFFEWPRDSSGEDVAESLGVSPPTFHQHVRAGERKLLGALLEG